MAELLPRVDIDVLVARLDALHRSDAGLVLIAVEWGSPTGFVVVNWFPTLSDDLLVAQIDMLLVAAHERRRGVGRLLLKAAAQAARTAGCGSMRMSIALDAHESLRAFCKATGFETDGELHVRALRKKASASAM